MLQVCPVSQGPNYVAASLSLRPAGGSHVRDLQLLARAAPRSLPQSKEDYNDPCALFFPSHALRRPESM